MLEFKTLLEFFTQYGTMKTIAHDKSNLRPAQIIEKDDFATMVSQITNLKDGASTWVYSVEIEPSR